MTCDEIKDMRNHHLIGTHVPDSGPGLIYLFDGKGFWAVVWAANIHARLTEISRTGNSMNTFTRFAYSLSDSVQDAKNEMLNVIDTCKPYGQSDVPWHKLET